MYLFNNCRNRQHVAMYGNGAFYDLNTTGFQATLANNLPVGETCVVASLGPMDNVTFDWYRFVRETVKEIARVYRAVLSAASTSKPRRLLAERR